MAEIARLLTWTTQPSWICVILLVARTVLLRIRPEPAASGRGFDAVMTSPSLSPQWSEESNRELIAYWSTEATATTETATSSPTMAPLVSDWVPYPSTTILYEADVPCIPQQTAVTVNLPSPVVVEDGPGLPATTTPLSSLAPAGSYHQDLPHDFDLLDLLSPNDLSPDSYELLATVDVNQLPLVSSSMLHSNRGIVIAENRGLLTDGYQADPGAGLVVGSNSSTRADINTTAVIWDMTGNSVIEADSSVGRSQVAREAIIIHPGRAGTAPSTSCQMEEVYGSMYVPSVVSTTSASSFASNNGNPARCKRYREKEKQKKEDIFGQLEIEKRKNAWLRAKQERLERKVTAAYNLYIRAIKAGHVRMSYSCLVDIALDLRAAS